jgi:hypothetical protein
VICSAYDTIPQTVGGNCKNLLMKDIVINKDYKYVFSNENKKWILYFKGNPHPIFPRQIFKYYSNTIENIAALHDGYFWLANPKSFNDPFDCNMNLIHDARTKKLPFEVLRNDWKNIGICSFSEVKGDLLMWAHYTNNYNGFVVKFKKITIKMYEDSEDDGELCPVIYTKKFKILDNSSPIGLGYVLTVKDNRWAYEKEWRILKHIREENDRKLFFESFIVEEVYIGHKLPDEHDSAYWLIANIIEEKYPNAKMYVVYPSRQELKLDYDQIYPLK